MTTTIETSDGPVTIRPFARDDAAEVARFANDLPEHDLLFLSRDLRHARVIEAWREAVERGEIESLIAVAGERVVATSAVVRDPLSWSPHVAEIRLLVAPDARGKGVGRALLEKSVGLAIEAGAIKLLARMTPDQTAAITVFEEAGFRGEAMLRDQVRDRAGAFHDLAILALDTRRAAARRDAYA